MTLFVMICAALTSLALAIIIRPLVKGTEGSPQRLTIAIIAIGLPLTASTLYSKIGDTAAMTAVPSDKASGPPAPVMQALDRARAEPENFDAQVQAADLYYRIRRYDEAVAYLNKANRLRPDDVETIMRLGLINAEAGNLDAASTWLKAGLAKQPDNAVVLEAYCVVLMHEGDRKEAEETLHQLETIDPQNPDLPQIRTALKIR